VLSGRAVRKIWLLALMLGACSGPSDPGLRPTFPGHPAAAGDVDWADTQFVGAGGVKLYAQHWRPRGAPPKAVVIIHHGLVDHSSRYAEFASQLVHAGYAVWAYDMRGHARSAGARVSFDRVDDLLDDLDAFIHLVREQEPGKPIFLYGHSLGGTVSTLYTIERHPDIAGLVVASPAILVDAPPILAAATPVLAALAPTAPTLALQHSDFSQRPEVVQEMDRDPLIYQRPAPARTARVALQGASRVWAGVAHLTVPLLAVHGAEDHAAAPAGSRNLVESATSADKTLRIYPGLRHDTLREPNGGGEMVRGDIIAWLDAHSGGSPVTYASSPPTPLLGDRRGHAISVELDLRDEQPRTDTFSTKPAVTAGLRLRMGVGRATPIGLGYYGGLDVRAGYVDGGYYEADLHAAGLALRGAHGSLLSITGGIGIGGPRGNTATHAPLELGLELPAGSTRVLARAGLGWRVSGPHYASDAHGIADEATALLGIRIGRDRRYWADLAGGGGPYLAATYHDVGGAEVFGLAVGVDLWGGD
jgi:alpha-beta hydrolase superfamily lysophospholipase